MWLSLIMALLTYLMSPRGTSSERNKALLAAAGAGALTYGLTEYTDWGQENLKPLDNKISGIFTSSKPADKAAVAGGSTALVTTGSASGSGGTGGGLWETIKSWGPAVVGTVGGAAVAASMPSWVPIAAIGVLAYLILKD